MKPLVALLLLSSVSQLHSQSLPQVGQRARLTRLQFCADRSEGYRCPMASVRGVLRVVSPESITVALATPPPRGLVAWATTGLYQDSLIVWRPGGSTRLEILDGSHGRAAAGVRGAVRFGLTGIVFGAGALLLVSGGHAPARLWLLVPAFTGVVLGGTGFAVGYLVGGNDWRAVRGSPGGIVVSLATEL